MSDLIQAGTISVRHNGTPYNADWWVVGDRVEVARDLGTDSAPLGPLRSAPGTVAGEKLAEMARRANKPVASTLVASKPTIRDMMRWRP